MKTTWTQVYMEQTRVTDTSLYELNSDLIWGIVFVLGILAIWSCLNKLKKCLATIKQFEEKE